MNIDKNDDLVDQINRLLEWLHQSDGQHLGSHITLIKVEKGAQYFNHVGSQVFNTDKFDALVKDRSSAVKPSELSELSEPPELPEPLATPEAMALWQKAQQAGYVNEHFQPLLSRTLSAILAFEMAKRLAIKDKWKIFEAFWNRRNMYRDYYTSLNQNQSLEFREKLKAVFA